MSLTAGAVLLTISLATGAAGPDKVTLPRAIMEAGLKKAQCTIPPAEATVVGTERLSSRLQIVEVACWRAAYNAGSILFAMPIDRPQAAELLSVERWQNGRITSAYSVPSPGYDPHTRTLNSHRSARDAGDCGTIGEWKWTGWHFRLLNVWSKDRCDGEPFDWDSRDRWQVFPQRGLESGRDPAASGPGPDSTQSLR